jgi:hypothetical protein
MANRTARASQAMKEEQEFRIVAIPGGLATRDEMRSQEPAKELPALKAIRTRATSAGDCRYVALFEG